MSLYTVAVKCVQLSPSRDPDLLEQANLPTSTRSTLLMAASHKTNIEQTTSPGDTAEIQKDSGNRSCQERWVGYQCNCYFISKEFKTWKDSSDFCISQNSALLQLDNRDELHFMKLNSYYYWIGVTYSAEHRAWVWLNGSAVSQNLFPLIETENPKKCIIYNPSGDAWDENCTKEYRYICKQHLT
ncbi:natural killer cells antigen CD94-like [Talpa occidentalis]|uniref:natural killer cells antigen CD94-like n=1 Tax=Talpa occidentalis TaxID=50954 RepID=UPI0018904567|nr:natural killer cells antigen CD94-like [Talpa occidentalis]